MPELERLKQDIGIWLEETLALLREKPVPVLPDIRVRFNEFGAWITEAWYRPNFAALVTSMRNELAGLPATGVVRDSVEAETSLAGVLFLGGNGQPVPLADRANWLHYRYLEKLVLRFVEERQELSYDQALFDGLFAKLEQYANRPDTIEIWWTVAFRNLGIDVGSLELDPNVVLRSATEDERAQAVRAFSWLTYHGMLEIAPSPYVPSTVLEISDRMTAARGDRVGEDAATATWRAALLALRLSQSAEVDIESATYRADNPFLWTPESFTPSLLHPAAIFSGRAATITEAIADDLRMLWPQAKAATQNARLAFTLGWFGSSYSRTNPSDRLVDHWIALESLFATDGSQELRHRASLRIARFVGRTAEERQQIFKKAKASYNLRSTIVHGAEMNAADRRKLPDIVDETGGWLRQSLRSCLAEQQPPSLAEIDASLLA